MTVPSMGMGTQDLPYKIGRKATSFAAFAGMGRASSPCQCVPLADLAGTHTHAYARVP